jgi:hypothetical protein
MVEFRPELSGKSVETSKLSLTRIINDQLRPGLSAVRRRGDWSPLASTLRGWFGVTYPAGSTRDHLQACMDWMCAAQDGSPDNGVAAFYDVRMGEWCPSYPETSGYIIPTFYDYAALTGREEYRQRARRMADWLLTLQLESGAFPIGPLWPGWERKPIIFDTGQIIFGLVRTFEETGEAVFLQAARRAGDWLIEVQDADGSWRKHTSLGHVHTYNVRTAWAMLKIYQAGGEDRYCLAARRNLDWALGEQDEDGWFRNAAFRPEDAPLTHTIAYTVEGLLESGVIVGEERYIDAARRAADAMRRLQGQDGFLRARYGRGWESELDWSCLTGTAQMALCWLRFYELSGDAGCRSAALEANRYLKQRQALDSPVAGFRGGISGSYPIYAGYEPYRQLNWAAKFFADSLMLELRLEKGEPAGQ